jgi:predicted DNA-binding transcriptional regulator AlpA
MSEPIANQTQIIRPANAAKWLGVSKATFWRIVQRGDLQTVKISNNATGVRLSDLEAYIAARVQNAG